MSLKADKTKQIPVLIMCRVSTKQQETKRQIAELTKYAKSKNYHIVEVCEEMITGTAEEEERSGLQRALELAESGKIKKVLVWEISRIARTNSVAHKFLETLDKCKVSLYWHTQGAETILPNGRKNPATSLMFALLAEQSRYERELLIERIKSGLDEARRKGKTLGRPKGTSLDKPALLKKHADVVRALKKGYSVRNTAKITSKSNFTVQKIRHCMVS